jgi:opacity protein-like surface antigen
MTASSPAWSFDNIQLTNYYIELKGAIPLDPWPLPEVSVTGLGQGEWDPDDELGFGGAVGAFFAPGWRAEFEFSWLHGEDGDFRFSSGADIPHSGDVDMYNGMINVYHHLNFHDWFSPYIGGGVGLGIIDIDDLGAVGGAFVTDDSEVVGLFAAHVGVDVPITPMLTFTTRATAAIQTGAEFDTTAPGVESDLDGAFSVGANVGLRINFN